MVHSAAGSTLILSSVSFMLGCLLMNFVVDHRTLWQAPTPEAFDNAEQYYALLSDLPHIVLGTIAFVFGMGLVGHLLKLHKGTAVVLDVLDRNQSNTLFDGGSLVLMMIAFILVASNLHKGIQTVKAGVFGEVGREDTLRVIAASNVIICAVLFGVILLQIGQGHAERATLKEIAAMQLEAESNESEAKKDK